MNFKNQKEIMQINSETLQLRYILGGLSSPFKDYWGSWHNKKCKPVNYDESFVKALQFIIKHNLDNKTFLILVQTYLHNGIVYFQNAQGNLFNELEHLLRIYKVNYKCKKKSIETNLKEKEIFDLINTNDDNVQYMLKKYNLTTLDLVVLLKTSICFSFDTMFIPRVKQGLFIDILALEYINNLSISKKDVLKYLEEEEIRENPKTNGTLKRNIFKKN